MAKHIFDSEGRQIGTILDDDELPETGCLSRVLKVIEVVIVVFVLLCLGIAYYTHYVI